MAKKISKVYYFYPMTTFDDGKVKLFNISLILKELKKIEAKERIMQDGEGNVQLKKIEYNEKAKRWKLSFLRNKIDAPFITKLDDETDTAEALDEDEFVGQECCMLFDEESNIIALQNNRSSISFGGIAMFLVKYSKQSVYLSPIVYQDKYCEISNEPDIEYKTLIIGFTDVTRIRELATTQDEDESILFLAKLTNDMSAVNGKIELGVGRTKGYLGKHKLKQIVDFFKRNPGVTNNLKVKMQDGDTIRLIDLISNKADDQIEIAITKDDPKTFYKILNSMDAVFDVALDTTFKKCKTII